MLEEIRVITGIIAGVLGLYEIAVFIARRIKSVKLKFLRGKKHIVFGHIMIGVASVHGMIALITAIGEGLTPAMTVTVVTGMLSLGLCIALHETYDKKKKLGNWLKTHAVLAFVMVAIIIIHIVFNGIVA